MVLRKFLMQRMWKGGQEDWKGWLVITAELHLNWMLFGLFGFGYFITKFEGPALPIIEVHKSRYGL